MYKRHHNTGKTSANHSDVPVNQFAPRRFVVQPQTEESEQTPDLQAQSQTTETSSNNLANISIFPPGYEPPPPSRVQMKLTIGQPGDKYEQEADKLAADVVQQINAPQTPPVQAQQQPQAEELRKKPIVQRLSNTDETSATPDLEASIQRSRGSGQPLAQTIKEPMEQAFGADFSSVKVHTDGQSDQMNQSIQAKAFTTGQDVFFRQGAYQPNSREGQELLAHELTHVVQQNEEQVQRSSQQENTQELTSAISSHHRSEQQLQPSFELLNSDSKAENITGTVEDNQQSIITKVVEALKKYQKFLQQEDQEAEQILQHQELVQKIGEMLNSNIDHGRFNLENEQHLLLFYHRLKRQINSTPESDSDEEKAKKLAVKDENDWENYKQLTKSAINVCEAVEVKDEQIFKQAILGAGASVAYYLVNASQSIDFENTVLIGEIQPWSGERGKKGVINHPMNMIEPEYQSSKMGDGLANREEFSKKIEAIISQVKPVEAKIQKVEKKGATDRYYRIQTDKGVYYAQNVVSGLGIGKHKLPDDFTKENQKEKLKYKISDDYDYPRIMNMDEFQRLADEFDAQSEANSLNTVINSMIIIGPNAAIDVATTALRHKIEKVYWVTKGSGDPAFLEGTDNVFVKDLYGQKIEKQQEKNEENPKAHTRGVSGNFTFISHDYLESIPDDKGVTVKYGKRGDNRKKPPIQPEVVGSEKADIAVYGLGPDSDTNPNIFGKDFSTNLEPVYDIDQHFNYAPDDHGSRILEFLQKTQPDTAKATFEKIERIIKIEPLKRVKDDKDPFKDRELLSLLPSVTGYQAKPEDESDKTSLQFIGASAARIPTSVKYAYVSQAFADAQVEFNEAVAKRKSGIEKIGIKVDELAQSITKGLEMSQLIEKKDKADDNMKLAITEEILAVLKYQGYINQEREKFLKVSPVDWELYSVLTAVYGLARRVENNYRMLREFLMMKLTKGDSASNFMAKGVINTLPQNVVLPDQLAPSRSMVEVQQNAMPMSFSKGINLVTSDHTTIAAYVAVEFGEVPPPLADYVTAKIVYDRRNIDDLEQQPLPQPKDRKDPFSKFSLEKQQAFGDKWIKTLGDLNKIFS